MERELKFYDVLELVSNAVCIAGDNREMSSDEPLLERSEIWWLEDPEFQRRARSITRYLVKRYQLQSITADDLYQATMMKFVRHFQSHDSKEISNRHGFFYIVARNETHKMLREQKHRSQILVDQQGYSEVALEDISQKEFSDNLDSVRHIESRLLVNEIMESLNEEERRLLYFWINSYTYRQIATEIGMSHVTVANRLSKLLEKIKASIHKASPSAQMPEK